MTLVKDSERKLCAVCGRNPRKFRRLSKSGYRMYKRRCSSCDKKAFGTRGYTLHKKAACEVCEFVPEHPCQLDVHHKDGFHDNHDPSNLETLCANCHRLVHHT